MFPKTAEEEAFFRWQRREFLELERQLAKMWRLALSDVNYDEMYHFSQKWFAGGKPKTLGEVKALAEAKIDRTDQEAGLKFGMALLGIPDSMQQEVMVRWRASGKPAIREFAPYFRYIYSVDMFFYLAMAADLISRVRPAGKANNKIDIAYLYYLPFCKVFTSSDNLHERVVPFFLRADQSFVKGPELKNRSPQTRRPLFRFAGRSKAPRTAGFRCVSTNRHCFLGDPSLGQALAEVAYGREGGT